MQQSGLSVMVGASGIGKTRTLLELLSWTYGAYFEAPVRPDDLAVEEGLGGSCDMAAVAQSLDETFDPRQDSAQYRRHRGSVATNALRLCIVFRLLLLQRMAQLSTPAAKIDPYKWLVVQLLLCGYDPPAGEQRVLISALRQLISHAMWNRLVQVLASLDSAQVELREKVKYQLFDWPRQLVRDIRDSWTSPSIVQAVSSTQSPAASPTWSFLPFQVAVDEAQALLGWENTHYGPVSEMSPDRPGGQLLSSPGPSISQAPPYSPRFSVSSSSSSSSSPAPTTPTTRMTQPASSQRSLFSMLVRCLNSYEGDPEFVSFISGSSLTLLDRTEPFSAVGKELAKLAVQGPPLRSVQEQVEYIQSVLKDLPDPVVQELRQTVLLRGRCRFAAHLINLMLTAPVSSTDLLEHVRQCGATLLAHAGLANKLITNLRRRPELIEACQHLFMAYLWKDGLMDIQSFDNRVVDLLKWGLVPLNDLRGGQDGLVTGKVQVNEPILVMTLESVISEVKQHITVDALVIWYMKIYNLPDAAGKLFDALVGYSLQKLLRHPERRNNLFFFFFDTWCYEIYTEDKEANEEAVRYAQSLHFNAGYCSFIDSSRTSTPMSEARRKNPPAGDEFQVFFPSKNEGADVVCFGKAQDQTEVAVIVQNKFYQGTVQRTVAEASILSTRSENLGLQQHHPSIRILCMWPSSDDLASLFRSMRRAARHITEDYFILLDERAMERFLWSDPQTGRSLREFKRGNLDIEAEPRVKRSRGEDAGKQEV